MNVASVSAARLVQDAGERRGSARRALCAARCGPPRCRSSTVRRRWASSSCPPTVPAAAARAARPRSTTSLHQVDGPSRSRWRAGRRGGWEADYLGARQQLLDVENPSCRVPNPYDRNSTSFVVNSVDDPTWLANSFPDSRIIELRHNATGLWERGLMTIPVAQAPVNHIWGPGGCTAGSASAGRARRPRRGVVRKGKIRIP